MRHDRPSTGGLLLAGGASRRMGRDKASLPFGPAPMAARVYASLAEAVSEIVVVTNEPARFPLSGARCVGDRHVGRGPLEGLASGLEALESERGLLVACDMPFVTGALLAHLADAPDDADAIVPLGPDGPEPLLAVYSRRLIGPLREALDAGERRMREFLPSIAVRYLPLADLEAFAPDGRAFWNLNRPEDYAAALSALGAAPD